MTKPTITLDTNAVINHYDSSSATRTSINELEEIFRLMEANVIDVAITTRVEADLMRDKNGTRRATMLGKIDKLQVVGTVFRPGFSKLDYQDGLTGDGRGVLAKKIEDVLTPGLNHTTNRWPNKINDIDHLVGHKLAQRDVFVTDEGPIMRKKMALAELGINVMYPADCLRYVCRKIGTNLN